jgi:DNA sulfur modification protein DndD
MIFKRIKINNYKTYLSLDLDLSVGNDRPIILIGGMNGGGKTTLFEAICGALYGLKIRDKAQFMELLNNGAVNTTDHTISLELTFVGMVLSQEQKYILKRTYKLNPAGVPVESVGLNMNGNLFVYGTATPPAQRKDSEQQVNKIIKANLPQELSQYFLFDAMQSSELLKENVFAKIIRDNIENVMGFHKYVQLKHASETTLQEQTAQRMKAQEEAKEYEGLCQQKKDLEAEKDEKSKQLDTLYKTTTELKAEYEKAKAGIETIDRTKNKISTLTTQINETTQRATDYAERIRQFVETLEVNVSIPVLANHLSTEINAIIRQKESIKKEQNELYSIEEISDITNKVIDYLKEFALCSANVNAETVSNYVMSQQKELSVVDEYSYLDNSEVEALKNLLTANAVNEFISLNQERETLNLLIEKLPSLREEKEAYEKSMTNGNEDLIKIYESKIDAIGKLEEESQEIDEKISRLDKQIHNYDIQIQQEPDPKYDTLAKLPEFFKDVSNQLLKMKKQMIENEMKRQLNMLLISYKDCIARVELSDSLENFSIKLYHKAGNEISLNQLNAASKQIFIQVLLKVLRNLGDYNPPVMIDTVMGVLDEESRNVMMEEYFPKLAEQTILLCTTSEIRKDSDYIRLEPFISKSYTLDRNVELQKTDLEEGYFGIKLQD